MDIEFKLLFYALTQRAMTRKEYLIKVLSFLEKDRPVATGLKILIQEDVLETETLDTIQKILDDAIEKTKNEKEKKKLQTLRNQLTYIQEQEAKEKKIEEADLTILEAEMEKL